MKTQTQPTEGELAQQVAEFDQIIQPAHVQEMASFVQSVYAMIPAEQVEQMYQEAIKKE